MATASTLNEESNIIDKPNVDDGPLKEQEDTIQVAVEPTSNGTTGVPNLTEANNKRPKPSALLESTLDSLAMFPTKISPFTQRLNKGFVQVRQMAQERLGTAGDITELPEEYKDLEKRVDALNHVYQNILKVSKTYSAPYYDYPVQLQESLRGLTNTVTNQIQQFRIKQPSAPTSAASAVLTPVVEEHPKTLSHAIGRVALQSAIEIGVDDCVGAALEKLGAASEKLGDARVHMDQEVANRLNTPLQGKLKSSIDGANKARRQVQSKRLALDAAKANYRDAPQNKLDLARLDVEQAEDQFVGAVEEATQLMKAALEDSEFLSDLTEFARAQLNYFKHAQDLFSSLVPELEGIKLTQESMYRNIEDEE
ncbi:Bin/amphiphysin/Rvs domain for vesicular trafficking-domain-containing protein [Mycotypha africana]|uniref:Bin/amphiphysin/Rvs domain for vesicular trafficking-domain-containing protein n=1 Tax=Mycotypha africana TaxID=64632 RepID=UPI0023002049|nr:Bin/amphiphysin/Rvs domain for vesicular trafficking-domain-containing protein [Mycotypha africana]KAI8991019.1 Bin/amphiphysin/Rvs domain for vesicular trafficking-domain-containing protein [Mycotypha africana]